jgi:hypothetical protein
MEKTCFKCQITLPIEQFYKHAAMADGRLGKCKDCTRKDVIANRAAKIDYYRAYDRERNNAPQRVIARAEYVQTPEGRAARKKASGAWDAGNRHKKAAQTAVNNAKRDGRLHPQPCRECGSPRVQAHHTDYSRPLEVVWLCTRHHADHHKQQRRAA